MINNNQNNNYHTPQSQNQITTPFGYNNNANLNINSPLTSLENNSPQINYSPNYLSMNNQQNQQQQKHKTAQVYLNPNLPYATGVQQLSFNKFNNKDISLKQEKNNQNEENISNKPMENLISNNQFNPGDTQFGFGGMAGMPGMQGVQGVPGIPNNYIQNNFSQMGYGMNMNNIYMKNYEQQQNPQMFNMNMNNINNNLNYSFLLNDNMMNKQLKNNNGNMNINLNKPQLNYDMNNNINNSMNINNLIQNNINYTDNNKFYHNKNNNIRNPLNNKGSQSMQGLKNTMPNFNSNENLNFPMISNNPQHLLNNRNNQRQLYNQNLQQQNYLMNGNIINNNIPNSTKIMRNEKMFNLVQRNDIMYNNNLTNKKNFKQLNNNSIQEKNNLTNNNNNYRNKKIHKNEVNTKAFGQKKRNLLLLRLNFGVNFEIFEIDMDEDKNILFQKLQKRFNINDKYIILIYHKIMEAKDKIEKIFNSPLNPNSSKELYEISNILKNDNIKNSALIDTIKNKNNLLKNYSFDSIDSFKYKRYNEKYSFSNYESKRHNTSF
jgi:hypothetical protein